MTILGHKKIFSHKFIKYSILELAFGHIGMYTEADLKGFKTLKIF